MKIKIILFLFLQQNVINFLQEENLHYINIEEDKNIFFWLFKKLKNNNELDESLTFWFQGGPGCSSMMAIFEGCGEYRINEDNKIEKNIYSWSKLTNIVFLDFPYGTGFSKSKKKINYPIKIEDIKYDIIIFIEKFLKKFPEFKNMKIYFAAESYATRFIIDFASFYIKSKNSLKKLKKIKEVKKLSTNNFFENFTYINNNDNNNINYKNIIKNFKIKGLFLLSGFIDPYYLNMGMLDFSIENKLIKKDDINYFKNQFDSCGVLIKTRYKLEAANFCFKVTQKILGPIDAPFFNKYDIRMKCDIPTCYDYSKLENLMNNEDFQKKIKIFKNNEKLEWKRCNWLFMKNLKQDSVMNLRNQLKIIKDKLKLYLVHGDKDLISNFNGIHKFSELFFGNLKEKSNDEYDEYKNSSVNLYKVLNSGHMIAKDQPEIAYNLFKEFLKQ